MTGALVVDTSVPIDLERGSLLAAAFRLPFAFAVPDLLHRRELRAHGGEDLIALGLEIEELDGDGVALALRYRRERPWLSLPDSFAFVLARTGPRILPTGDDGLRRLAREEGIECHGLLWLLDRVFEEGTASGDELCAGLATIGAHRRCRLPQAEIRKRLGRYSGA